MQRDVSLQLFTRSDGPVLWLVTDRASDWVRTGGIANKDPHEHSYNFHFTVVIPLISIKVASILRWMQLLHGVLQLHYIFYQLANHLAWLASSLTCLSCLYCRYSVYGAVEFMLAIFPIQGHGTNTLGIPCTESWSLLPGYQGDFVGAQEWVKIGCPSCHHHWRFWDLNPCKSCILIAKPRLAFSQTWKAWIVLPRTNCYAL